jgi:ABC-2 type transport system ATP-binding protein
MSWSAGSEPRKRSARGYSAPERSQRLRVVPDPSAIEASALTRTFGDHVALDSVSITVRPGEIHALLGPNGAGKTVTLRMLSGLLTPTSGSVRVMGIDVSLGRRATSNLLGFVPAGDRTFYLRLSGLENLIFFARLHGMRKHAARDRARAVLADVGLGDRADVPVNAYSHGMQKRLSVARALLTNPSALLVDEATHDLDPHAAEGVRDLVAELARDGAAVLWTTQRLDEIRGFAHRVTLLREGHVRFCGTVNELMAHAQARRFVLRLGNGLDTDEALRLDKRLTGIGDLRPVDYGGGEHWLLDLNERSILGDAIAALSSAGVSVLTCHRERSEVEDAFASLSRGDGP